MHADGFKKAAVWLDGLKKRPERWLLPALLLVAAFLLLGKTGDAAMTSEEKRIAAALSRIQGAGEVRVTLYYEAGGGAFASAQRQITGALAVARGAGSAAVRLRLTQALETLLGLSPGSVLVLEMEGSP
ncbi:MAG: hypothetical protein IJ664_07955 [Clostridia bacterium]|nr:hypothetical protein [Clostridia bacterium]